MSSILKKLLRLPLTVLPCLVTAATPDIEENRAHWAFLPLLKPTPPQVRDTSWPRNDIDRFVLAGLEASGLKPAPEASRATLIRRLSLDLTGLPPSPDEVEQFVSDPSPRAYEALVEKLLASQHYGERWARHWLDLARYADTSGFHNDLDRPQAWKYRDYVIRSFNEDKPYARFIAEQIAGDELEDGGEQGLIATGFCRNGPSNDDNMGKTPEAIAQYQADQMDDVISTTASVFLGLTLGCARCHDHKTEPLSARDYYSFYAIFAGTERLGLPKGATNEKDTKIKDEAQVMALVETRPEAPATHILLRGQASNRGDLVGPAVPAVLTRQPPDFPAPAAKSTLRRKTLAEWIASPQTALTWRVIANRVWQHHFGSGIVATPGNLGLSGARPSNPELLDWLAERLLVGGGKLKDLHRQILLSATYRQQRKAGPPENPGLRLQRMEAEVIRDSILAVSGRLNPKMGGPGIKPRIRPELLDASQRNKWPVLKTEGPDQWRRSIYIYVKRQLLMPSLELFDAPTTTDSCALRPQSTVPTQALVLMNDEFVEEQAGHLASRARKDAGDDPTKLVDRLFMITLSHPPTPGRKAQALDFLRERTVTGDPESALRDLAHVLLNSSEFLYID